MSNENRNIVLTVVALVVAILALVFFALLGGFHAYESLKDSYREEIEIHEKYRHGDESDGPAD